MALALNVILAHYIHAGQQDYLNDDVMLDLPEQNPADNLLDDLRVNRQFQLMNDEATALDSLEKKDCRDRAWTGEKCKCNSQCKKSWFTGNYWCYLEGKSNEWRYCCVDDCKGDPPSCNGNMNGNNVIHNCVFLASNLGRL